MGHVPCVIVIVPVVVPVFMIRVSVTIIICLISRGAWQVPSIRTVSVNQVKKPIYTSSIDSSSNYTKFFQHLNRLED